MNTRSLSTRTRHRWREAAVAIAIAAAAGGTITTVVASAGPASAATVDPNATYVIVNRHSGKAVDVYNWSTADGAPINQCAGIASLGGATLDNEENYLIKKLFTAGLGMVWVENQARV